MLLIFKLFILFTSNLSTYICIQFIHIHLYTIHPHTSVYNLSTYICIQFIHIHLYTIYPHTSVYNLSTYICIQFIHIHLYTIYPHTPVYNLSTYICIQFIHIHLYTIYPHTSVYNFVRFKILFLVLFKSFYIDHKHDTFYREVLPKVTEEKAENFISTFCLLVAIIQRTKSAAEIRQCTSLFRSFGLQFCGQLRIAVLDAIPISSRIFVYEQKIAVLACTSVSCSLVINTENCFISEYDIKELIFFVALLCDSVLC